MVKCVDVFSEGLRGMFARKDAWELLEKGTFTVAASEATAANAQAGGMPKALQMANPALVSAFALNAGTTAARTDWRPLFRGLKVYLKTIPLSCFAENLITSYSNGFKDARHTGILTPMSPIFDQEPLHPRQEQEEAFGDSEL